MKPFRSINIFRFPVLAAMLLTPLAVAEEDSSRVDLLSFAQGAVPVEVKGAAHTLKVGMDRALLAIDGNAKGFVVTPKPGAADAQIIFVYKLPALTTFSEFAIPNILETPSPSQTFIGELEIAGSSTGPKGPFSVLASRKLEVHSDKNQFTLLKTEVEKPVQWVQLTMSGGIDIQRDKSFFEFSEIIGYGRQETVPLLDAFTGKWKGRGVLLELKQEDNRVSGCYDRAGDLTGTVQGNLLRATGKTRSGDIPSTFLLTVTDDGQISGVRSTNGAPFRAYEGAAAPGLTTECSDKTQKPLGCGSIIHGINFDFDSAAIRPESGELLDELFDGLKALETSGVTIIGHTSSEGSDAYNQELSQRRAEAVVAALVTRGIESSRLAAQGLGEDHPIADNATGAGRSLNRRVEIACR